MASFTQADLDTLNKAIAQGVLRVEYADKIVEYRSLDEMLRIRGIMMDDLGIKQKPRRIYMKYNSGLE